MQKQLNWVLGGPWHQYSNLPELYAHKPSYVTLLMGGHRAARNARANMISIGFRAVIDRGLERYHAIPHSRSLTTLWGAPNYMSQAVEHFRWGCTTVQGTSILEHLRAVPSHQSSRTPHESCLGMRACSTPELPKALNCGFEIIQTFLIHG